METARLIEMRVESPGITTRAMPLSPGIYHAGSGDSEIALRYPTVSRLHGRVAVTEDTVTFTDLGSHNGSAWEDGAPSPAESTVPWPEGKALRIGPFTLRWRLLASKAGARPPAEPGLEPTLMEALARRYACLLRENPSGAKEVLAASVRELPVAQTGRERILEEIHHEFHGDGPLRAHLADPSCREILINRFDEIYLDLGKGPHRVPSRFLSRETFEAWATRTAHAAGRRLDLQHPICEATLEGGARFHAVLSPVSARGVSVAIRRFGAAPVTEDAALASGWVDAESLALLKESIHSRRNMVISGGTSTGKTSLLNFVCSYLDPEDRVLTVEDTVELSPPVRNLVQLQARNANADGAGEIPLRQLVQCALRMRPDRIIVGECRGGEVLEMLQALNTGHPGSLTTIHANSPSEAIQRLELLALLGAPNLSPECVRRWIESSVERIVQVARDAGGHRHVSEIARRTHDGFQTVYRRAER